MAFDWVIRGATVIDGSGEPGRTADVGIRGDRIAEVGRIDGSGDRETDGDGLLLTPGWVDVHTHYDGQVSWDSELSPSCWHGVTSVVMGNCGVGFAPVREEAHDYLIKLMEGVEDIPGTALAEGIQWEWETFPEYLDAIGRRSYSMDVGAQVPHGALRFFVMGDRGTDHTEVPTPEEIELMADHVRASLDAGALGFTTSRTMNHRTSDGRPTPSLSATPEELIGISRGMERAGKGVFEMVSDFKGREAEWELFREMVRASGGRPMSISIAQSDQAPDSWRDMLRTIGEANEAGLPMKAQVASRAIGLMLGLQGSLNPFSGHPSFRAIADLPLAEQVARLRDPELKRKLLAEEPVPALAGLVADYGRLFLLGDPPDYEPSPDQSLEAHAKRRGIAPNELAYEWVLENEGRALLYRPFLNYSAFNLDAIRDMLLDPNTVPGLGDAGAHCGMICDGSFPTHLMMHWGRDRSRGERLPLEWLVKQQTADTADLVGLSDRGRIAPGQLADLNLVDFEGLALRPPEIAHDLPAGGRRLIQRAAGYKATWKSGVMTFEDGEATGALPGALIRGAR